MNIVRDARKALGLTQQQLAAALEMAQPSISRYENDPEQVDEKTRLAIRGLCAERGVSLDGYPESPGYVDTDTSKDAAASFAALAPAWRQRVLDYIRQRPSTCAEVEAALKLSHQTASARIRELALNDRIEDSGERRKTPAGRNAIVWREA